MSERLNRRDLLTARQLVFRPETGPRGDVLVSLFLRGGMDGLHAVPPHADEQLRRQRPTLALHDAGKPGGVIDLDGFYGLHPELAPLAELFRERRLAIVHACGSPDRTLSHFEAMQTLERGVDDGNSVASGWISRHLAGTQERGASPLRALAFGDVLPKSLQGSASATAVRSLTEFRLPVPEPWTQFRNTLAALYGGADPAAAPGRETLRLLNCLERLDPGAYRPEGGAAYPKTELGRRMAQVAQLIKAEVGLEIAALDLGGWDSHVAQDTLLTPLLRELARALHAFHADLGPRMERVTVVAMTEFGRRVHENSGLGTDHGRAGALFLLGGGIRGGRVYGSWPGLHDGQLDGDGDLRVTTDFRSVLGEVVRRRLGNERLEQVFPGFAGPFLNVTR